MRDYLGISEIGMCARRVFYAHRPEWQEAKEESRESLRVMNMGTLLEDMILSEWLLAHELNTDDGQIHGRQLEVTLGPCKGHLDGYAFIGGRPVVLDAKASTWAAIAGWKRNGLPDYYRAQGIGYMDGLSRHLGVPVEEALFIALDRLSGRLDVCPLSMDTVAKDSLLQRAEALDRAIANGPAPDREFESSSTACKHCPWRKACWGAVQTDFEDADEGRVLDASDWPGFEDQCTEYADATELLSIAKERQDDARSALETMLSEHKARGGSAGFFRVTCAKIHQDKFDTKAFREKEPKLWEKYKKEIEFTRVDVRRKA